MRIGTLAREQEQVLHHVWHAERWYQRARGLLLRAPLQAGQGLLITPCDSVHMLGMGYALDVLFLDREGRALSWRENLRPWRAAWCRGAHATVEMPVGSLASIAPAAGQLFTWRAVPRSLPATPEATA